MHVQFHWVGDVSYSVVFESVTPWTVAQQAPLSMGFPRQEYWSMPFPSPGYLPNPGIRLRSPALQDSLPSEPPGKPQMSISGKHLNKLWHSHIMKYYGVVKN